MKVQHQQQGKAQFCPVLFFGESGERCFRSVSVAIKIIMSSSSNVCTSCEIFFLFEQWRKSQWLNQVEEETLLFCLLMMDLFKAFFLKSRFLKGHIRVRRKGGRGGENPRNVFIYKFFTWSGILIVLHFHTTSSDNFCLNYWKVFWIRILRRMLLRSLFRFYCERKGSSFWSVVKGVFFFFLNYKFRKRKKVCFEFLVC